MVKLVVRKLEAACGAEVRGFDPRATPDEQTRRVLRRALDDQGVLVFPDIDLDWETQQYLIELVVGSADRPEDAFVNEEDKNIAFVSNREPGALIPYGRILWHTDSMWSDRPEDAIALYGLEVEADVAPTLFTSTIHAWNTLPEALRTRVRDLWAIHGEGQQKRAEEDPELFLYNHEYSRSVTAPVALPHPRTGKTMLYVSEQQTRELVGLPSDDGAELLEALLAHLYSSEHIYEHDWRQNDFVVWDNLAVQHTRRYVALDGPVRTLRKVAAPPPWVRPGLPALPGMVAIST